MNPAEAWQVLGIAPTDDERAIKRAYSGLLKSIDVDRDPDAFIRLRSAMETAKSWGAYSYDDDDEEETWEPEEEDVPEDDGRWDAPHTAVRLPLGFSFGSAFPDFGGEADFTGYRPSLPFLADDDLAELCAAIDRLLFDEAEDEAAAREQIGRAGRALLKAPGLEPVDAAAAVEGWLAAAIAAAIPRSDPLATPAINHFGWHRGLAGWNRPAAVDAVLARYDDRVWMVGPSADVHARALAELGGPPRTTSGWRGLGWFELGKAAEIEALLKAVRRDHPSVEQDLDAASVAWWDAYLAGRRPPAGFWLLIGLVPFALVAVIVLALALADVSLLDRLWSPLGVIYAAALGATLAFMAAQSELRVRRARRSKFDLATNLAAVGWAPLLLILPLAAASSGGSDAAPILFLLLSAAVTTWGVSRTFVRSSDDADERQRRWGIPTIAGAVSLFVLLSISPTATALTIAAPLAALCWMGRRAYDAMALHNQAPSPRLWTWSAAGLLLAHIGVAAALAVTLPATVAWAMTAVPVLLVAQHWWLAGRYRALGRIEFWVRLAALAVYFTRGVWAGGNVMDDILLGWMIAAGAYGLMLSGACLIVVLREEGVRPLP